jgi:hypothetical protein
MNEGRALQVAAILICVGVISGTVLSLARKFGGTVPGMIARTLKWLARWVTNAAVQYDVFLCNWREYVEKNPIVMKCEKKAKKTVASNIRQLKKAQ